jgi:hypothetical protein
VSPYTSRTEPIHYFSLLELEKPTAVDRGVGVATRDSDADVGLTFARSARDPRTRHATRMLESYRLECAPEKYRG